MATVKLIFGLALLSIAIYGGAQLVPPYLSDFRFEDAIRNEANINSYSSKSEDNIQKAVFLKAQDLGIAITPEQIHVRRMETSGGGTLLIEASYSVTIDLPAYPVELHFNPSSRSAPSF